MDLFGMLYLDELSHGLANLSMFPYFDMAHYIVSVMALREQPGALDVSRVSPLACWFSSMLYCFGGAVLSGIMLAEPPVAPLSNGTSVLLASIIWYLIFYCPMDVVYSCTALLPLRLVLSGMKEVTRTWKVLGGVTLAQKKYKDSLLVMIAIGWARGAGGGLISNFEQLVRGVWKPETNELLKMSYPTKVTLMGAVLFSLQQTHYLPLQKHHLMLFYTIFIVVNKTRMMLTGSSSSPFAPIESALYKALFTGYSPYAALTGELHKAGTDNSITNRTACCGTTKESKENRSSGQNHSSSPGGGVESSPKAKEASEAEDSKKIN
ncbi:trimeric intracellular cation channel type B [Cyprinodon tularosa]|uniref:Transmembrane protein 38B n=1 Tax=Cyprinodon variegatus TaxID=28743 RepID=A0A3Q2ECP9_CYPVA|nr:PREDICTED: trimeric intracellular cation channel type B [Cyprinodon variegatus]XP_038150924.1 trimeric intracellular cation channel type B [Cyprinodon tularosa]